MTTAPPACTCAWSACPVHDAAAGTSREEKTAEAARERAAEVARYLDRDGRLDAKAGAYEHAAQLVEREP